VTGPVDQIATALLVVRHLDAMDILLQKLRWYRRGGEVSDRQWRDIAAIVRVQGRRLDREYLRESAGILGVSDLLERALGDAPPDE
jgi:hypothetical protein